MVKKILIALLVVLIIIQFFHPPRNQNPVVTGHTLASLYFTPTTVKAVLEASCNDCHSNNTVYPWYSKLQPVDWWMTNHVNEGKAELNFDEFATYSLRRQYRKTEEMIEQVKEQEMPLNSYTWIHKNAILNTEQKDALIDWATSIRTEMEKKYPKDSLVRKK